MGMLPEERRVVRLTAVLAWGQGRPQALSTEAGVGDGPGCRRSRGFRETSICS